MRYVICSLLIAMLVVPSQAGIFRRRFAPRRPAVQAPLATSAVVIRQDVRLDSGLVVVPFAVPVAVPVATILRPTLFYSYRQFVDPAIQQHETDSIRRWAPQHADRPHSPADDAVRILSRRCAACHSGPDAKGGLELFDLDGRIIEKLPRRMMLEMIRAGKMPAGKQPRLLSEDEIRQIETWATPPRDLRY